MVNRSWCVVGFFNFSAFDSLLIRWKINRIMGRRIWNIVLLTAFSSFIVCGHVYKDYTNNAVLLSSVYDAMKNNLQENIRNNLNRYDVLSDMRNKRNVNEKVEYYDALPSDSLAEYVQILNYIYKLFYLWF